MSAMEEIRLDYKHDAHGNPINAVVFYPRKKPATALPIALVFHLGGFMVGSVAAVPRPQINYLLESGFVAVVPNYRLAPQVSATQALEDCEHAYEWAVGELPGNLRQRAGMKIDPTVVVAMGHSSGGTIALHLASCKRINAVTAFYPSLFLSDTSTSAHRPTSAPPFGTMPDYEPQKDAWASIQPDGLQVSEAPLAAPGTEYTPRDKWQMQILKTGQWMSTIQPDGDFDAIDPMTRLTSDCPPLMIVQGEIDSVPGSSLELAQRAEKEIKDAGVEKVALEIVAGQGHAFDLPRDASEPGDPRWAAVMRGLDWLNDHRGTLTKASSRRARVPQLDVHIRYV